MKIKSYSFSSKIFYDVEDLVLQLFHNKHCPLFNTFFANKKKVTVQYSANIFQAN